ncbi:hypothetical protein NSS79_31175 [Paenibacillus sp. FSL L8-0436]|uniref:hypothetical protein n=1 Tax=Paenibacillus sp. FSL L8-0436 TaxID=2954686 RepID=UPI00315948C0
MNINAFTELSHNEALELEGGGWLDTVLDFSKEVGKTTLGKVVAVVSFVQPAYDFAKGVKAGWDGYYN